VPARSVADALIAAAGVWYLSRIPVHGTYPASLLPRLVIMAAGVGAVLVAVTTAANADVGIDRVTLTHATEQESHGHAHHRPGRSQRGARRPSWRTERSGLPPALQRASSRRPLVNTGKEIG
jgi:hypothetical protein